MCVVVRFLESRFSKFQFCDALCTNCILLLYKMICAACLAYYLICFITPCLCWGIFVRYSLLGSFPTLYVVRILWLHIMVPTSYRSIIYILKYHLVIVELLLKGNVGLLLVNTAHITRNLDDKSKF